jgi:hypothetical protein
MHTVVVWIALAGLAVPATGRAEPGWLKEYGLARKQGQKEEKPLAIFIGSGKAGWNQISRQGQLGSDVKRLLAENYVCVYIDTDRQEGQRLASAFEMADGPGVVISSFSGKFQAFRHEGDLDNEALAAYLRRFADPDRPVETTETNPPPRASYYQAPVYAPVYAPMMGMGFAPSFGGGGRGGC